MAVSMDLIKRVVIQGSSQGLDKLEGELRKIASSSDDVTVSFEKASRSQISAEAAYKRLTASIDPTDKAQQQIAKSTSTLDRALQQGIVTQDEYARRLGQVREKYSSAAVANDNMANSSKLARHELINLSRQVQDVGVSIYSGQPAMTVFIQQGSQIADVFIASKTSLADFGRQILGFVARNPFSVLAGGVAALGAGVLVAASYLNNYVKVLDDLSRSSGIAAKDLSQLRESAAVKGVGNADFTSGINAFADKIAEAKKGTNELGQLFRLNGRAISDNVTNLYTVADLVKNAADYQDKKNILEAAGLPTTAEAVRYYSQGAEQLKKQKEEAVGFGAETEKLAANARAFEEAWNKSWESFKNYAVTSIAESLAEIKKLASEPTVQAIIAFMSLTPEQAYGVWKGAVSRTIGRAKDWFSGRSAPSYDPGLPSDYEIPLPTEQYGPDRPTQTVKDLKDQIRVLQERNSLLGESATAADKLALAELRIQQAVASGINLTDQEMNAIRANAVAVKEKAAAHDKVGEALRRANEGRQEAVAKLELEIKDIFKSTEALRAEKIALEEIYRLRKAGVPEDKIPFADIEANARRRAELERQVDLFKDLKNAAQDFATTLIKGLAQGESLMQSLGQAAIQLGDALIRGGIAQIAQGNLITGGLMIGGGYLANMFGQNQKDKEQQQQAQQQAAQQAAQQLAEAQRRWAEMSKDFLEFVKEASGVVKGSLGRSVDDFMKRVIAFGVAAHAAGDYAGEAQAQAQIWIAIPRMVHEFEESFANFGVEISSVQQNIKKVNDDAADLTAVLIQFGAATDSVALRVEQAMNRMRDTFLSDLARKIHDASGFGWVNELNDLVAEVAQLRADAAALGVQTAMIDQYYVLAAQNVINNSQLTGDAFNSVAAALGPLGSQLHEFSAEAEAAAQALKRSASEIAATIQGYQDQLFVAGQNTQTLSGALAVFDLQAQRDREAEIAKGGQALAALEALQAQQRMNIIQDFNARALDEQKRLQDEQKRLQEQQQQELERTIEKQRQYVASLQSLKASLFLGANSTLSPRDQLAYAQSQFASITRSAAAGDENARGQIQSATSAYLEAARAYYGSSDAYVGIFTSVQNTLDSLIASGANSISTEERQLSQMQTQTSLLSSINDKLTPVSNGANNVYGAASAAASAAGIDLSWMSSLPGFPAYANGTDFHRGGMAIVGERGPEIVNLPRGSRVTPANDNGDAMAVIASTLERILAVLSAGERMNAEESARTTEAVRTLSRQISTSNLSRARAS